MLGRLLALALVAAVGFVVAAAPVLAQSSGPAPDYVLKEGGTVVIEGDATTDCTSFAIGLELGDFDNTAGARVVLEQCEEAGLLTTEATAAQSATPVSSVSPSAADGEGHGGLPDTGGPGIPALLGVLAVTGGLLARGIAKG